MKTEKFDQPGSLMSRTIELAKADQRTALQLCIETKIPFYWMKKFLAGEFLNPSVNRVQYLYEHLTGSKLI